MQVDKKVPFHSALRSLIDEQRKIHCVTKTTPEPLSDSEKTTTKSFFANRPRIVPARMTLVFSGLANNAT